MLKDIVAKNRSRRWFHQEPVARETLRELVDLARLSASGGNVQALKYFLVCDPETNAKVFPLIGLAGEPPRDQGPTAYIIILRDRDISESVGCDQGIAAQSILLGATEKGLGGCMVGIIDRIGLRKLLDIPTRYEILLLLIIGRPKDTVAIDPLPADGDTTSHFDNQGVWRVPKRDLDDIIIG